MIDRIPIFLPQPQTPDSLARRFPILADVPESSREIFVANARSRAAPLLAYTNILAAVLCFIIWLPISIAAGAVTFWILMSAFTAFFDPRSSFPIQIVAVSVAVLLAILASRAIFRAMRTTAIANTLHQLLTADACPQCNYDLRGAPIAAEHVTCPECGLRFQVPPLSPLLTSPPNSPPTSPDLAPAPFDSRA